MACHKRLLLKAHDKSVRAKERESMATPNDDDPLHVGSKPVDEPHEASVQPQGVLRTDSGASDQQEVASGDRGSSSDQQIAENLELPAEFRLIYQPPTVSLQGWHKVFVCMACERIVRVRLWGAVCVKLAFCGDLYKQETFSDYK